MKLSYFIFSISILLVFSACQNESSEGVQQTSTQSKTPTSLKVGNTTLSKYQHPLKIYSLLIPNKWSKEYTDKTQTITIEKNNEEAIDIITIVGSVKLNESKTMEAMPLSFAKIAEDYLMDNIKNTLGFSLIENINFSTVKPESPGHLVFDYRTKEGIERRRHTILRQDGDKGFYLHLNCKPENFEDMDEIFRAMDGSFEVLEGK